MTTETKSLSRGNSLSERYPGDRTHKPLSMLKTDAKHAHRSHHLRKTSMPAVDIIDSLDEAVPGGAAYHHEGPYDATLASRNQDPKQSPVAALTESNKAALQATSPEKIKSAVEGHRPLEGVAEVPAGYEDVKGRKYDYVETNLMVDEGGNQGKVVNVDNVYEPTFDPDVEQHTSNHKVDGYYEVGPDGPIEANTKGIEMDERPRHAKNKKSVEIQENELDVGESSSKRHSIGEELKKRIGSLRRKKD